MISTPKGGLATSSRHASRIASRINSPVVVKAQIRVAGRGKAGGIIFASSAKEAELAAKNLLGAEIKGRRVRSVWVEEKIPIHRELYLSVTVDRTHRCYVVIASSVGGVEIEETALVTPNKVVRFLIDPLEGFKIQRARSIAKRLGYAENQLEILANTFLKMYAIAIECDAELAEMNPLAEIANGRFIAVDTRLIIDDNALFRHPEFAGARERETRGLSYVKLDGNIGVVGNGAGLVMATLDAIQIYGGCPANFLDVGGGASADRMALALKLVFSDPNVEVVLVNIWAGITRCDEIAKGIRNILRRDGFPKPLVIRLVGTREAEGRQVLREAGISVLESMENAVKRVVELAETGV